jgi:hypothetical protein
MTEIILWILFVTICASAFLFCFIDDLFRLLAKVKIFSICTFNAESCLRKMEKARLAKKRKERNLIKEYINDCIKRGKTDIRMGINYEDNLKWLKEKGFRVELDNELHHMYYVSWGEDK